MNRWPRSSAVWLAHHWDEKATLSTVRRPASHSFLLFPLYHGPRTFDVKDELLLWMPSPIQEVPAQAVFSLFRAINVFCMTRSIVSMSVSSKTARIFTDGPAGGTEAVTLSTEAAATEQIAVPAASSSRSGTRSRSFASGAMTVVDCLVVAVDIAESHQDAIKNRIGNCFQPESPFFFIFCFSFQEKKVPRLLLRCNVSLCSDDGMGRADSSRGGRRSQMERSSRTREQHNSHTAVGTNHWAGQRGVTPWPTTLLGRNQPGRLALPSIRAFNSPPLFQAKLKTRRETEREQRRGTIGSRSVLLLVLVLRECLRLSPGAEMEWEEVVWTAWKQKKKKKKK